MMPTSRSTLCAFAFCATAFCAVALAPTLRAEPVPTSSQDDCEDQLAEFRKRFDAAKGQEPQERIVQIGDFVNAPCDATVRFLAGLFAEEGNPGIHMAITDVLGQIASESAVKAIVEKALPALVKDAYSVLAVARALEGKLDEKAQDWLLRNALRSPDIGKNVEVLERVIRAMGKFDSKIKAKALLAELARNREPKVQAAILGALEGTEDSKVVSAASKLAKSPDASVETAALALLYEQGGKKHTKIFESALRSKNWEARLLGLRTLARLGHKKLVVYATKLLEDPEPKVQITAVRTLYREATPEVVEVLIARIDKAPGRVQDDIIDALTRLTGKDLGPSTYQWEGWWEQNKAKFKTLKPMSAEEFSAFKAKEAEKNTVSYHGLRILSDRFVFIFDSSESMKEEYVPIEEREKGKGRTVVKGPKGGDLEKREFKARIDVAKAELQKVINGLKDGKRFDVIRFESVITDFIRDALGRDNSQLVPLDVTSRENAVKFVNASIPQGQTYMLKALETAFENEEVDTIYLLSDGAPTPPDIAGADVILERMRKLNRLRNVKINTIGFDLKPEETTFLRQLADENFGVFVER